MLIKKILADNGGKRIKLSVWKHDGGVLVMRLHEVNVEHVTSTDGTSYAVESFILLQSWSKTVATAPCKRATKAAIQRFYDAYIGVAQEAADQQAATWSAYVETA